MMGILKIVGAVFLGASAGAGALYIDNKVRKAWTVPDRFPDKLPILGGRKVPLVAGKEFEAGWGLVPLALVIGAFAPSALLPLVAGVSAAEGGKVASQYAPNAFMPPAAAAAMQQASVAGGIHVGALGTGRKLIPDDVVTRRWEALAKRAVT